MNRGSGPLYASEKDYWRDFATDARRLGSELYADLALAIDGDAHLKGLTAGRRPGQPAANLLLAAVHYILLREQRPGKVEAGFPSGRATSKKPAGHPLRNFYPTLGGVWSGENLLPQFQDFVARHEDQVRGLIESRVTNTNEVARSCVLRAGFAALAQLETAPLHLVEIGPSAGLNLNWDRYGMNYRRGDARLAAFLPESPLQLDCELRGALIPPLSPLPRIAGRVGLELHPVDLLHEQDRDWLRALVWPDQPQRLDRLDRAIALFRQHPQPIRSGDALTLLPQALAEAPPQEAVCVYHTITTYQFSAEMREALFALLVTAGLRRPVWHLQFEFDGGEAYVLTLSRFSDGGSWTRTLAKAQPHGGWMEWLLT